MVKPILPDWSPLFFIAEGALGMLCIDGSLERVLGAHATGLALTPMMAGVIWWQWYRKRLPQQER